MFKVRYSLIIVTIILNFFTFLYIPYSYSTPFTPLDWKQEVPSGHLCAGQKKFLNYIHDEDKNFIDDRLESLLDDPFKYLYIDIVIYLNKPVSCSEILDGLLDPLISRSDDMDIGKFVTYISFQNLQNVVQQNINMLSKHRDVSMIVPSLETSISLRTSTETINSRHVNNLGFTGSGVNIAILDTGVDNNHDAFQGRYVNGYDAINDNLTDPLDADGHGTHVAGIALGDWIDTSPGVDVPPHYTGVAPNAGLVDIKVLPGTDHSFARGIEKAIEMKDQWNIGVINMSNELRLSTGLPFFTDGTDHVSQLANMAVAYGIVFIAAAGNDGPNNNGLPPPGAASLVITVANSNDHNTTNRADDTIAFDSNHGPRDNDNDGDPFDELKPDIAAPGENIFSAEAGTTDDAIGMSGTSMAAPHVAGVAALILEAIPTMNPGSVKELLKHTAVRAPNIPGMDDNPGQDSPDDPDYDSGSGNGLVDAFAAIQALGVGTDIKFPSCIDGACSNGNCLLSSNNQSPPCWVNETDITLATDPGPVLDGVPNVINVALANSGVVNATGVKINIGVYDFAAGNVKFHELGSFMRSITAGHTIIVSQNWIPALGHRCIQVSIDYGLDTNFSNNVTQRNISVQSTSSPAVFNFNVENPLTEPKIIELEPLIDTPGWTVTLEPRRFKLHPFTDCPVSVTATLEPSPPLIPIEPPSEDGRMLLGGVSLRAIDPTAGTATCHIYTFAKDISENRSPIADAGPDMTIYVGAGDAAEIYLDGSGSYDPDGDTLTYEWNWSKGTASGINPSVILPLGINKINLTISDDIEIDTDTVVINVNVKKQSRCIWNPILCSLYKTGFLGGHYDFSWYGAGFLGGLYRPSWYGAGFLGGYYGPSWYRYGAGFLGGFYRPSWYGAGFLGGLYGPSLYGAKLVGGYFIPFYNAASPFPWTPIPFPLPQPQPSPEPPIKEFEFFEEVPAWRMPGLAVTGLTVDPERVNPGEPITFRATVSNLGTGDTKPAELVFLVDEVEITREAVEPLAALKSIEFTVIWTAGNPGRHRVLVDLELGPGAFDLNLENNTRHAIARVSGAPDPIPELEVGDIDFNGMQLIPGESYVIPVKVRNPGFVDVENIPIAFYIDSEQISTGTINYLAPGEEQELQFPWSEVTRGEHMIAIEMVLPDEFPDPATQSVKGWHVIIPDTTVLYDAVEKHKWSSIGPRILDNNWIGRISCFAYHPSNPSIMYAGSWGLENGAGGVWKTTNEGLDWFPVGDKLGSMKVMSVAVDDKAPTNVYIGTAGYGIWKSRDSGLTWDLFAGKQITGYYVTELIIRSALAPESPRVLIYAATNDGVRRYRSDDPNAQTSTLSDWDNIKLGTVGDLAVHPVVRSTVFAILDNEGRLYRTEKGITAKAETTPGVHDWTLTGNNLPVVPIWSGIKIDIYRSNPAYVYASVRNPRKGYHFAIYRSSNWGNDFQLMKEYAENEIPYIYNAFIRVHPNLLDMVYFGGINLFKWSKYNPPQGQTSWTYNVDSEIDMKALEFPPSASPSVFYLACDQGMFRYTPSQIPKKEKIGSNKYGLSGDTYEARNNNLRVSQMYDFDLGTSTPLRILAGTQDTGSIMYKGSSEWSFLHVFYYGDGMYSLIAPSNNDVMYVQFQGMDSTARSANAGKDWKKIVANNGLPTDSAGKLLCNNYIIVDPHYPNTVLAACGSGDPVKGGEVYATTDAQLGENCTWTGRGPFGTHVKGDVRRVVIQPNTTHWYAGTSKGQIWYTTAKIRGNWDPIDSHDDQAEVMSMAFSPKDPNVLYVLYSGGDPYRRVQRLVWTSKGGWNGSWIKDNLDIEKVPQVICGDAHRSDVAYVGTRHGVFRWDGTKPTYDSWQDYNDGFPLTSVRDLKVGPDKMLYAATMGRGAWRVITGP